MLLYYKVKNFFSIKDEIKLDWRVSSSQYQKSRRRQTYAKDKNGNIVSLSNMVIGANASGKTNILKALAFFRYIVTNTDNQLPLQCFNNQEKEDSLFEACFSIDDKIYTYRFVLNNNKIIRETVREKSLSTKNKTSKLVFDRKWDQEQGRFVIKNELLKMPKQLNPNGHLSLISSVVSLNQEDEIAKEIYNYWLLVYTNVSQVGVNIDHPDIAEQMIKDLGAGNLANDLRLPKSKLLVNREEEELNLDLRDLTISILRNLDIDFDNFSEKKQSWRIQHRSQLKDGVPLKFESSGIRQLIEKVMVIAATLLTGGILIVDELGAHLHPEAALGLINLFQTTDNNPNQAQIIFSSHYHQLIK